MSTFTQSVKTFKKAAADWLTPEDDPALVTLEKAAAELDKGPVQASLINAFGVTYRALLARKPAESSEEVDPLDDLIPVPGG